MKVSEQQDSSSRVNFIHNRLFFQILALALFLLLLPAFALLMALSMCFKYVCTIIIKRRDKHFFEFMHHTDVIWNLKGDSVMDVISVIETKSLEDMIENIKSKLNCLVDDKTFNKIFYRRHEKYGFYYWRKYNKIDVSQYIEMIDVPGRSELSASDLEELMAELANKPLPYDDHGLFKILITKQKMKGSNTEGGDYGMFFRFHHSIGDGIAIMDLFHDSLCDKSLLNNVKSSKVATTTNCGGKMDFLETIKKVCDIPLCVLEFLFRRSDVNSLHGPPLKGIKIYKSTAPDEDLLVMVKEIRRSADYLNFTEIILAAFSGGLNHYFTKTMADDPDNVLVIIPVRCPWPRTKKTQNKLYNEFLISFLDLPVKDRSIDRIDFQFTKFKEGNEFLAFYYFMKLGNILPKQILNPLFYSRHATVLFSNIPGPERHNIFGGNVIKSLIFFVPLKGSAGVAVSALSYDNTLRFAVSADKGLVAKPEHLSYITEGMVDEIKRLHAQYVRK